MRRPPRRYLRRPMILIEESCKIYLDEMKMSRELGFDKEPHISIMCGTILHAVSTHQIGHHSCGRISAGCFSDHLYRSTQSLTGNCWGLGNRTESSLSGVATHHHLTPGSVLLVGPGDLLVVVLVTLLGRTPHHSDRGQITVVGLKVLESQGFSEQTSAVVLLCLVSASES